MTLKFVNIPCPIRGDAHIREHVTLRLVDTARGQLPGVVGLRGSFDCAMAEPCRLLCRSYVSD